MGAIASGGVEMLDARTIRALRITREEVMRILARERQELERRERAYREGHPPVEVRGRTVILVDDGLATRGFRSSSTSSCITTRLAPWSRWSVRGSVRAASCRRRIRRHSERTPPGGITMPRTVDHLLERAVTIPIT